jgi:hypothetical protein
MNTNNGIHIKLDHVVYFTGKSPEEIVEIQQKLGRHAVVGGSHEKWGTCNALMYVSNAYVEWLSVERLDVAKKAGHPLTDLLLHDLENGDGWGTICLSVNDIDQFNLDARKVGFKTSGVLDAQRKTPAGKVRKWKMLFIEQDVMNDLPMPFFIQWEQPEKARLAELRADGTFPLRQQELRIKECIFKVNDPDRQKINWCNLLGQKPGSSCEIILPNVVLKFVAGNEKERLSDVVFI